MAVLTIVSDDAILLAVARAPPKPIVLARSSADTRVLAAANIRHAMALTRERLADSPVEEVPHWTLDHNRSPRNIVTDLVAKSMATIDNANIPLSENIKALVSVMHAATTRHEAALTAERIVLSTRVTEVAGVAGATDIIR